MADDKLIFPIGFDLQKGVEEAGKDWDKYAQKLESALAKRAIKVKLNIDTHNLDNLDAVKQRLSQLKIEPITPQTKSAIKELVKELSALAKVMEKVSSLKGIELPELQAAKAAKIRKEIEQLDEKLRLQQERVRISQERLTLSQQRAESQAKKTGRAYGEQEKYLKNLLTKMISVWSIHQVQNFLTKVREVTAEFELQRVSLGAIIQDQQRANQLFGEIKSFALKSPIKILDLTTYVKQVAAYRIETDKLFDTTKRLADVSVGLGVDMGRLVLAYGQVKAASYLRAAEIRQFTEAGIPMLELLAEKFTVIQGKAVSTEQVMDLVSKRAVSFSMVEDIFKDMTDAGGMFYNMQEKQAQTLFGMWSKLGDAAAVMYEEIGNTSGANGAMKGLIQLVSDMMNHWTALANVAQTAVIGVSVYKAAMAGMIPLYRLQNTLTINQIKAEKSKQAAQTKTLAIGRQLTREEQLAVRSKNKLMAADYKRIINEGKLSAAQKISLGRQAASNVQLRRAVIELGLFTKAQIAALGKMSGWQLFWAKFKLQIQGIGQSFVNLGRTLMSFAPLAAITSAVGLFMDWRQAVAEQEGAIKKVEKQYEETKTILTQIENAYRKIQSAAKDAGENEVEFAKTSYSQKLAQLQKVIKLLGQFGMKNVIDISVLDYTNIDPVLDNWIAKLNDVNELSRNLGHEVALIANAYEGNIFGWSIFGENFKEDMKDAERSWTKFAFNPEFNNSLEQLKSIVGDLSNSNKDIYDTISKTIGADLQLALGQRRRNESELQYQKRIHKNYQNIVALLNSYNAKNSNLFKQIKLPKLTLSDHDDIVRNFEADVKEMLREFDKVKEVFRDKEALTVKAAIDHIAAENDWTDWQRELLINHLNENPITLNAEIIPTTDIPGESAVSEGLKAIITSEFPTLFNENELQTLVSAEEIVAAIKAKLDASNESLEKSGQLQNNIAYGSKGYENTLNRIKQLQDEITEVENMRAELSSLEAMGRKKNEEQLLRQSALQAKLQEIDEASLNSKRAQIAAIVKANPMYDELIQKQRESAEAEREIAKAALERVTSMGLSDLGTDVKQQFGDLMGDDKNFLISDKELKNVQDVADLYDLWANKIKTIKDEKEKLVGVGISEATIAEERAKFEERQGELRRELNDIETELSDQKLYAEYKALKVQLSQETNAEKRAKIESKIGKILGDNKNARLAELIYTKGSLENELQNVLIAQAANDQIADYIKGLGDAEDLWEKLGDRYNFKLKEKGGSSGSDNRLQNLKEIEQTLTAINTRYEELVKKEGQTAALDYVKENYASTLEYVNKLGKDFGLKFEMPTDFKDLQTYRKEIQKVIETLKMKGYEKAAIDLELKLAEGSQKKLEQQIEKQLKELADKISRTKAAKDFYNKILAQTGDINFAKNVSISIYGDTGEGLFEDTVKQIKEAFKTGSEKHPIDIDISSAIDVTNQRINYGMLAKIYEQYKNDIIENNRDLAQKIVSDGQKTAAENILTWQKELAKAKDFEQQRTDIINRETQRRADIIKSDLKEKEKQQLISLSYDKQEKDLADLDVKEFRGSDDFIKMFENLDKVATSSLKRMREEIKRVIEMDKEMSPENMKAMVDALEKIDDQINDRGFGNVMIQSAKDYIQATKNLHQARTELMAAQAEYKAQEPKLNADIDKAQQEKDTADADVVEKERVLLEIKQQEDILRKQEIVDETQLAILQDQELEAEMALVDAQAKQNIATTNVAKAEEKKEKAAKKVKNIAKKVTDEQDAQGEAAGDFFKDLSKVAQTADQLAGELSDIKDFLGIADDSAAGLVFDSAIAGLQQMSNLIGIVTTAQAVYNAVTESNPWIAIAAAVLAVVSALAFGIGAAKVRKANKEIEKQQEILDQLEYSYGRLEKAAEKAFGGDYIKNFKDQQANLQAQITATERQLAAERSKGKKADDDKIKQYQESIRDLKDQLADMQGELAAHFLGTDLASAARDFAQAWLDAYKEFGNTADAMSEKFQEMIQNMVVEGAMAAVMERALKPMFDMIDKMGDEDFYSEDFWREVVATAEKGAKDADAGAATMMKFLEQSGISMRELGGDLTGISRDIANATEESINGLAAGINTQNYYISYVPQIAEHVAALRAILESGGAPIQSGQGVTDLVTLQNQSLSHLQAIDQHTAETVTECKRIAERCTAMADDIHRVVVPKGTKGAYGIQTYVS